MRSAKHIIGVGEKETPAMMLYFSPFRLPSKL